MFKKRKKKVVSSTTENEIITNDELLAAVEPNSSIDQDLVIEENNFLVSNEFQKTLLEYELENYEQVLALADRLMAGENLIVNVANLEKIERKRALEFLGGVLYVLQGKAKKVTAFGYVFITNAEK